MKFLSRLFLAIMLPFNAMAATQSLNKIAAVVNKDVITSAEVQQQVQLVKRQLASNKMPVPDEAVLQQQVLNHMIDVDLQLQIAKRGKLEISEDDINQAINRIKDSNHISLAKLKDAIAKQGLSYQQYRENLRKEITVSRLQQQVLARDVIITDDQVKNFMKNNKAKIEAQQQYHLANILIPLGEEPTAEQVSQAKAKAKNLIKKLNAGANFNKIAAAESSDELALQGGDLGWRQLAALPKLFADKAAHMIPGDVAGPLRTANGFHIIKLEGVRGGAGKHLITLTHARHILLKTDAINTPEMVKKRLEDFRKQILNGASFATLAKKHSQDIGSASKGGELGWVHPGQTVPAFEQAMTQLHRGSVSHPVLSRYGYHIIQVVARKQIDDSDSFAKQQVRNMLYQQKFAAAAQNWVRQMRAKAYVKVYKL